MRDNTFPQPITMTKATLMTNSKSTALNYRIRPRTYRSAPKLQKNNCLCLRFDSMTALIRGG